MAASQSSCTPPLHATPRRHRTNPRKNNTGGHRQHQQHARSPPRQTQSNPKPKAKHKRKLISLQVPLSTTIPRLSPFFSKLLVPSRALDPAPTSPSSAPSVVVTTTRAGRWWDARRCDGGRRPLPFSPVADFPFARRNPVVPPLTSSPPPRHDGPHLTSRRRHRQRHRVRISVLHAH